MRRALSTVGCILLLASTILWVNMVDVSRGIQLSRGVQKQSALKVAKVWELEVVKLGYEALRIIDELLKTRSGTDMNSVLDHLIETVRLHPYSRIEYGNILISLEDANVSFGSPSVTDIAIHVDEGLRFMGSSSVGTPFYVFVHVSVVDQVTDISKVAGGWVRIVHPARLLHLLKVCDVVSQEALEQASQNEAPEDINEVREGFVVEVRNERQSTRLNVTVRVLEGGVLGVFEGLNQDLICSRSFTVDTTG